MNPIDPNAMSPDGADPNANPKPWHKDQPQQAADGSGAADAGSAAAEGAAEVVGGIVDAAGSAVDAAAGCADGCGSCSLAVIIALFVTAQVAFAVFR
jgi:hypothetical protein